MEEVKIKLPEGMEHTFKPLTQEERERLHAENFNSSPGNLHEVDDYNCRKCLNRGWIMRAYEVDGIWSTVCSDCECKKIRSTIRRMKKSGLKNIIKDYTFEKFEAIEPWQQKLKDAAIKYADDPQGWFFIGGQSGAGKTHLCTAICRHFLLNGKSVKYMLWRDEVVKLKANVNDDEYSGMIEEYKTCDVLYIDDLFKTGKDKDGKRQQPTGADVNIAFEILNYRYNNPKLLTVISSELTTDSIIDIDEATGGRIFEKAATFNLSPDRSKNYRLKNVVEL